MKKVTTLCGISIGIDIKPEIVRFHKGYGFNFFVPEELPMDTLKLDIILILNFIKHCSLNELHNFMDKYLYLLGLDGYLIVAIPLMSKYIYDNFYQINPYQSGLILLIFGNKSSQSAVPFNQSIGGLRN